MHKALKILMLFNLTVANCYAQNNHIRIYGTVKIDKNISISQTEVTISEWMGFIACNNFDTSLYPNNDAITTISKILFDDLKQKANFRYLELVENKGLEKRNFGDKSIRVTNNIKLLQKQYDDYVSIRIPITGVSFKQVEKFCKWKEEIINQSQETNNRLIIQLPSIELYTKLIANIDSLCENKSCDSCTMYKLNYNIPKSKLINCDKSNSSQGQRLLRVDAYLATDLGLYCLQGNAAEMTSTINIAMGGSFRHSARQSFNDQRQKYDRPEEWLGFRYIAITR